MVAPTIEQEKEFQAVVSRLVERGFSTETAEYAAMQKVFGESIDVVIDEEEEA